MKRQTASISTSTYLPGRMKSTLKLFPIIFVSLFYACGVSKTLVQNEATVIDHNAQMLSNQNSCPARNLCADDKQRLEEIIQRARELNAKAQQAW
jgi:hypothetical protein